jgi:hypothetical protein
MVGGGRDNCEVARTSIRDVVVAVLTGTCEFEIECRGTAARTDIGSFCWRRPYIRGNGRRRCKYDT